MFRWMNNMLDKVSEYLAPRKGLLPIIGILFIVLNFAFQFLPLGWIKNSNLFLHFGLLIAILGLMLAWVL